DSLYLLVVSVVKRYLFPQFPIFYCMPGREVIQDTTELRQKLVIGIGHGQQTAVAQVPVLRGERGHDGYTGSQIFHNFVWICQLFGVIISKVAKEQHIHLPVKCAKVFRRHTSQKICIRLSHYTPDKFMIIAVWSCNIESNSHMFRCDLIQ